MRAPRLGATSPRGAPHASCVADVRGQRAGVGEPVSRAAALLGRAGARVPGASALPAAAAPVSDPPAVLCTVLHAPRTPHTDPLAVGCRYAITATAYRWVRDRNESQCIVITGE